MTFKVSPGVPVMNISERVTHMLSYRDNTIAQVRSQFVDMLFNGQFVEDKSGVKMLEIQGASFLADEPAIFGTVNEDYAQREIEWYLSQSRNVNDIPGGPPAVWKSVATPEGLINSNYGWAIFSKENGNQYENVLNELIDKPTSRRAVMLYTRPTMWTDYNAGGMSDFMCTNAVQYLLRDGHLDVVVQMRSNDVYFGYRNDRHWQKFIQDDVVRDLRSQGVDVQAGEIYWQVGSLHIYEKDFFIVDYYAQTGIPTVTKKEYKEKFPDSAWSK